MVRFGFATIDDMRARRPAAREQCELALAAARRTGHALLEGIALCNLGEHYHWCGDHRTAIDHLERSGAIARELGSGGLGGPVLAALGSAYARLGRHDEADEHFRRALEFARTGNTNLEVSALNDFADTKTGTEAIERYEGALELARRTGHLRELARAHHGLGRVYLADGNDTEARVHLEAALAAYTALRTPDADDVRALLGQSPGHRT
jgi:tetratricopeptide (TPR) repeat protein